MINTPVIGKANKFFFHPDHIESKAMKRVSYITNIFLSVITLGLWLAASISINRYHRHQWKKQEQQEMLGEKILETTNSNGIPVAEEDELI